MTFRWNLMISRKSITSPSILIQKNMNILSMPSAEKFFPMTMTSKTFLYLLLPAQTEESTSESLPQQKPESNSSTSSQTQISLDQAKQIALQKAGLEDSQVMWEKAEKDEDDGKILYELEFSYNHTEFNCEVDLFGNILKFEQETDD